MNILVLILFIIIFMFLVIYFNKDTHLLIHKNYLSNRSNGFKKYPKNTDKPTIKAIMKELTKGT